MALTPQGKVAGWSLFIGVPVALFLAGVGVGRWSKRCPPAEVREVVKTVEVERAAKADTASERTAVSTAREVHTVTRWIRRPDGTTEVERRRDSDHASVATAAKVETRIEYRDRWHAAEKVETRVTLTQDQRWNLAVFAGSTITWERTYGALVQARIVGPFSLGLWGASQGGKPTGGISVGVRW